MLEANEIADDQARKGSAALVRSWRAEPTAASFGPAQRTPGFQYPRGTTYATPQIIFFV
jgi:hypothetical protein